MHVRSSFTGEHASHVYVKQQTNGIPFANAVANVALNKDNKVVAFGSSFVQVSKVADSKPTVTTADAIATAEKQLSGKFDAENFPAPTLQYFAKEDNTAALVHTFQVRNEAAGTWFEAFVDAHSGELISVTDFVNKASYFVLPIFKEYPTDGFETLINPQDTTSSPQGWHDSTNTTTDNNAIA